MVRFGVQTLSGRGPCNNGKTLRWHAEAAGASSLSSPAGFFLPVKASRPHFLKAAYLAQGRWLALKACIGGGRECPTNSPFSRRKRAEFI